MTIKAKVQAFLDSLDENERVAAIRLFRAWALADDLKALKRQQTVQEAPEERICGGILGPEP